MSDDDDNELARRREENIKKQVEAAERWHENELKKLPELVAKIEALGGIFTMVHDEINVDFHESTPTENQEKILDLLMNHVGPKFEDLKLEKPIPADADPPDLHKPFDKE